MFVADCVLQLFKKKLLEKKYINCLYVYICVITMYIYTIYIYNIYDIYMQYTVVEVFLLIYLYKQVVRTRGSVVHDNSRANNATIIALSMNPLTIGC